MKITIEYYGKTITMEVDDGITSTEAISNFGGMLVAAGYYQESIKESLIELANE